MPKASLSEESKKYEVDALSGSFRFVAFFLFTGSWNGKYDPINRKRGIPFTYYIFVEIINRIFPYELQSLRLVVVWK
jgi:hypothetical protein